MRSIFRAKDILGLRRRAWMPSSLLLPAPRRLLSSAPDSIHDLVIEKKLHYINMPIIMDDKEGKVKRWLKAEGDSFNAGDCLCEISFSSISIGYEIEHAGILAKVLVHDGQLVEVDTPIAVYASNQDDYMSYIESKRVEAIAAEMFQQTKEEKPQKPDKMVLLREIKHLIQNGHIEDGSDFAKKLQSLARKGDEALMDAFQASFDGVAFNKDSFDTKFFLENAQAIVQESQ